MIILFFLFINLIFSYEINISDYYNYIKRYSSKYDLDNEIILNNNDIIISDKYKIILYNNTNEFDDNFIYFLSGQVYLNKCYNNVYSGKYSLYSLSRSILFYIISSVLFISKI